MTASWAIQALAATPSTGEIMDEPRIGTFILQHRYRIDPNDHKKFFALLSEVRAYALDLGVARFEVWQDDEDPWQISELHGYDSWSHYMRLSEKHLPDAMKDVYADFERLVEGGLAGIETRMWQHKSMLPLDR